jgi:uncharacterized membrane protein
VATSVAMVIIVPVVAVLSLVAMITIVIGCSDHIGCHGYHFYSGCCGYANACEMFSLVCICELVLIVDMHCNVNRSSVATRRYDPVSSFWGYEAGVTPMHVVGMRLVTETAFSSS